MQQKIVSITLSQSNSRFIIKDKGGIKLIRILRLQSEQPYDSTFWATIHLRVIDQKELTLFDHALSSYLPSGSPAQEVWLDEQFSVIDHLSIKVYAEDGKEFAVEVIYELGYE